MREPLPTDVAIRRTSDGEWIYIHKGSVRVSETPKFAPTRSRAVTVVRVDMGLDLDEVEFIERRSI